jgi:hypothetical protein
MDPFGDRIRELAALGAPSQQPAPGGGWQAFRSQLYDYERGGGKAYAARHVQKKYQGSQFDWDWDQDDRLRDLEMRRLETYKTFRDKSPRVARFNGTFYGAPTKTTQPYYDQLTSYDREIAELTKARQQAYQHAYTRR